MSTRKQRTQRRHIHRHNMRKAGGRAHLTDSLRYDVLPFLLHATLASGLLFSFVTTVYALLRYV